MSRLECLKGKPKNFAADIAKILGEGDVFQEQDVATRMFKGQT
jgi:hypothetical protein